MRQGPIVVFDSGIGGLSIYRPLKAALPDTNIVYIADSAYFPYGDKSVEWLQDRFKELTLQFAALNPSVVVLACNTATTNIIQDVRSSLDCPVVGVEPVIKPLAQYESALALMTESSARSQTTAKLLQEYGSHVRVYTPKGLAKAIEYNDYDQVKKNIDEIKEIVQINQVKAVGLSCTHYPLVLPALKTAMPETIFIDPSEAVVREVLRVLRLD
jgi:glutamate racemase